MVITILAQYITVGPTYDHQKSITLGRVSRGHLTAIGDDDCLILRNIKWSNTIRRRDTTYENVRTISHYLCREQRNARPRTNENPNFNHDKRTCGECVGKKSIVLTLHVHFCTTTHRWVATVWTPALHRSISPVQPVVVVVVVVVALRLLTKKDNKASHLCLFVCLCL